MLCFNYFFSQMESKIIHGHACGAGQESADVRELKGCVYEHGNAICLPELIYHHVRGCDVHRRADGNGCAPLPHAYANVYASIYMLL